MLTTRFAEPTDYPAIQALFQGMLTELAEQYPDQYKKEGAVLGLQENTFVNTLTSKDWAFVVAEDASQLHGVLQLSIDQDRDTSYRFPQKTAWIEELIIHPEAAFEETATALVEAAQAWAIDHKVPLLDCIVYHFNGPLKELLTKHGFGTVSTRVRKTLE